MDIIHFYFQVVVFQVKAVLKLIKMDSVNYVILVSMLMIIFVILVIQVVLLVLIVIIVFNVTLDITGQLQMEDYVLLVQQDVQLVYNLMDRLYVNHA